MCADGRTQSIHPALITAIAKDAKQMRAYIVKLKAELKATEEWSDLFKQNAKVRLEHIATLQAENIKLKQDLVDQRLEAIRIVKAFSEGQSDSPRQYDEAVRLTCEDIIEAITDPQATGFRGR